MEVGQRDAAWNTGAVRKVGDGKGREASAKVREGSVAGLSGGKVFERGGKGVKGCGEGAGERCGGAPAFGEVQRGIDGADMG